ncbi:hypothetical protein BDB00DRAFT_763044 [Zychaea mexicana]|uniref:uncharacterized protein n=1 Tax=Zychaea mexicana TaxID=64656 RepID=UPI0022FF1B28|nr:uncharacterized protein BDB00DRAFT_763044 [Zychaea mexicana]KAI9493838.1 hypothetical protein BDB00DRAFT_763044 [Zychaea mexicana]
MATFTASQVLEHQNSKSCWIIYKDKVYDITDFVVDHPGGRDIVLEYAGTDITHVLGDALLHTHSDAAYELLEEYYLDDVDNDGVFPPTATRKDEIINSDTNKRRQQQQQQPIQTTRDQAFLDLHKPLFPQLWHATWSKEYYLEQVHRPRFVPWYVPYFSHPWLDMLSHTPWYVVPIVWIPFVSYQLWRSVNSYHGSPIGAFEGFAGGVFFWTLLEYGLHRFVFHLDDWLPDHPVALLLHFTLHGIHHHMPMDRLRLVMPPALAALIGFPVIRGMHMLFNSATAHAVVAGAYFGYICYDCIHYYLHHAQVLRIHFSEMKRYHLAHHYKDYEGGYGITSKVWDIVFGTTLKT